MLRTPHPLHPLACAALCLSSSFCWGDTPGHAGAAMAPLRALLATTAPADVSPGGYLVSEKLDGVRALWDGQSLRFRSGRRVPAPAWFLAQLPAHHALDGELWLGRGRFDALSAIVRKEVPTDDDWRQIRYMVFEMPQAPGSFAERVALLQELAALTPTESPLRVIEQRRLPDNDPHALQTWLNTTVAAGGEGLMLHLASAPVESGRSGVLLKLKPQLDAEATVTGHRAGKGKYAGQTGALQLRMPDGKAFYLGSGLTDTQRRSPPPIGSRVTYRYRDLTPKGLPRFASLLRLHDEP